MAKKWIIVHRKKGMIVLRTEKSKVEHSHLVYNRPFKNISVEVTRNLGKLGLTTENVANKKFGSWIYTHYTLHSHSG